MFINDLKEHLIIGQQLNAQAKLDNFPVEEVIASARLEAIILRSFPSEIEELKSKDRYFAMSGNSLNGISKRVARIVNVILGLAKESVRQGKKEFVITRDVDGVGNIPLFALNQEKKIVSGVLTKEFDFKVSVSSDSLGEWNVAWKLNHPLLYTKPIYVRLPTTTQEARKDYFTDLYKNQKFSDFALTVEGKLFKVHKVILAQCAYFDTMFSGNWKECNTSNPVRFEECSSALFSKLIEFLYRGTLPKEYLKEMENCLDLLRLANFVQYKPLEMLCKSFIYENINEDNFLNIAILQLVVCDNDLDDLCRWFIGSHPKYGENLDFSTLSLFQLISINQIGRIYKSPSLAKASMDELKGKIALNDEFIRLCRSIKETKSSQLKDTLTEILKENKPLYQSFREGRKTIYKSHWEEFVDIMTDLSL